MSMSSRISGSLFVVAALCLGAPNAHAQVAAVPYSQANWPLGFGGDLGQGASAYGDFTGLDGKEGRPTGWFIGGQRSELSLGLGGMSQMSAFGSLSSLQSEGMRFGYNFQNSPLSVYGGFNALKYDTGLASQFAPSGAFSGTSTGYSMQAGVEYRPAPNLSLSLGASLIQMQPGRTDSDSSARALSGESSGFELVRPR
jgi:opacity protein-like surface antigen